MKLSPIAAVASLSLLLAAFGTHAQSQAQAAFKEGVHYERINQPERDDTPDKVEVLEAFNYACPHCNSFDPLLRRWVENAPDYVVFDRLAVPFSRSPWEVLARAYYTAEALGVTEKVHVPLFNALHSENRRLDSEDKLAAFFAEQGIDEERFRKTFGSFGVERQFRQAQQDMGEYGIGGVPTLIVDGKYRVGTRGVRNHQEMLQVVDFLAAKAHGAEQESASQAGQ